MSKVKHVFIFGLCLWASSSHSMEDDGFFYNLLNPIPWLVPSKHMCPSIQKKPKISVIHSEREWKEVILAAETQLHYQDFLFEKVCERLVPPAIEATMDMTKILGPITENTNFRDFSQETISSLVFLLPDVKIPNSLISYIKEQASQNHSWALFILGWMHGQGKGVGQDSQKARELYRQAHQRGHALSQYELGNIYRKENPLEAVKFYKLAAQKLACAQHMLAVLYDTGEGIVQNDGEAFRLYKLAADQGHERAKDSLKAMYEQKRGLPLATAEALKYYQTAAQYGFAYGQYKLGLLYEKGEGVSQDSERAARYILSAAKQGDQEALNYLFCNYYSLIGTILDIGEVVDLLKLTKKETVYSKAYFHLGKLYYEGKRIPQNYEQAYRYFRLAYDLGSLKMNHDTEPYLLHLFANKWGIPSDNEEKFNYNKLAAHYNCGDA